MTSEQLLRGEIKAARADGDVEQELALRDLRRRMPEEPRMVECFYHHWAPVGASPDGACPVCGVYTSDSYEYEPDAD